MDFLGDCADCLAAYLEHLKKDVKDELDSTGFNDVKTILDAMKSCKTKTEYHKEYVYKPAVTDAIDAVTDAEKKVTEIGNSDGSTIRNANSMKGKSRA